MNVDWNKNLNMNVDKTAIIDNNMIIDDNMIIYENINIIENMIINEKSEYECRYKQKHEHKCGQKLRIIDDNNNMNYNMIV